MTPDSGPAPPKYVLDSLGRIDKNVQELTRKFDTFISFEGPFVETRDLAHAHDIEIKSLKKDSDQTKRDTRALVIKVSGWTAALAGSVFLAIMKLFGGN